MFQDVIAALFAELQSAIGSSEPRAMSATLPDAQRELDRELLALRVELERRFLPEFCHSYLVLLIRHVGTERLAPVLAALDQPAIQKYFDVATDLDRELQARQAILVREMAIVARNAAGLV
jgi:hypothetical protein